MTGETPLLDFLRVMTVLAGVLALAWAGLRWGLPRFIAQQGKGPIEVVARQSLDPKKTLFIVRAGGREMLLAASDAGVSVLREWEASDGQ
jgi:flagellar biosynthetic protein FliO